MRKEPRSKARRSASPDAGASTPAAEPRTETSPDAPAASVTAPASEPAEKAERLAVTLNADGTIETDAMRTGTKEKLRKALSDRTLPARLGMDAPISGGASASTGSFFDAGICSILYDTISKFMMIGFVKAGYTKESVITSVPFTAEEKAALAPVTAKVLEKWIPISGKYQDEAMLGLMLFGIINGKLALLEKSSKPNVVPGNFGGPRTTEPAPAPAPSEPPA